MRLIATAFLFAIACTPATQPPAGSATAHETANASIVDALRSAGLEIEDAGPVEQSFFTVPAHVYVAEGDELQVYRYPSEAAAKADAEKVDPNGSAIGTSMVSWIAPPHFFQRGETIVNYLGSNQRVLDILRREMGQQFAGE